MVKELSIDGHRRATPILRPWNGARAPAPVPGDKLKGNSISSKKGANIPAIGIVFRSQDELPATTEPWWHIFARA